MVRKICFCSSVSPELADVITLTTPWIVCQTDLHQVGAVDQGEVTRIVKQSVVVQGQDLKRLQMAERLVLDVVDQVAVEVELAEACKYTMIA